MSNTGYKVTKKDLRKAAFRYNFMACNIFNYESQMGPAVAWALAPILRKIYSKDDEYKKAVNNRYLHFRGAHAPDGRGSKRRYEVCK